ncbi:MAG: transcriptional regulator NrdR [Puniceicoccales bacterium]|jgi:transcriptional repressor NrdR|nr:transcriptional regulator NrdR [Puniceicoccales bacterium]
MHCPQCQHDDTRVLDTRSQEAQAIKRRRQCAACGFRFSTLEKPIREDVSVEKRDGRIEEFDRQKIAASLQCALKKGYRQRDVVDALADQIVSKLLATKPQRLTSTQIGEEVMRCLKDFDALAYVRYLSVHRTFADLDEFRKRIGNEEKKHGDVV